MYLVGVSKALSASIAVLITLFWIVGARAEEQQGEDLVSGSPVSAGLVDAVPDVRKEKSKFKFGSENLVAVPIPISNPTIGTGLVMAAALSEAQRPMSSRMMLFRATVSDYVSW